MMSFLTNYPDPGVPDADAMQTYNRMHAQKHLTGTHPHAVSLGDPRRPSEALRCANGDIQEGVGQDDTTGTASRFESEAGPADEESRGKDDVSRVGVVLASGALIQNSHREASARGDRGSAWMNMLLVVIRQVAQEGCRPCPIRSQSDRGHEACSSSL